MELGSFVLLVLLAMGLALQPWSILAAVLFAAAKGGTAKAAAFLIGWIAALAVVGIAGVVLLPTQDAMRAKSASAAYPGVELALGLVLTATLIWAWRRGPAASTATPRWVGRIDTMSPVLAF